MSSEARYCPARGKSANGSYIDVGLVTCMRCGACIDPDFTMQHDDAHRAAGFEGEALDLFEQHGFPVTGVHDA